MRSLTVVAVGVLWALAASVAPLCAAPSGPAVTIYSRDLAFVREMRTIELESARDTVQLTEIPERLDFTSVRLVPEGGARVTRLAYRFDVPSGDGLLERARGSRVRISAKGDRVAEGTLIAADGSWLVVRGDDGSLNTLSRATVEDVRLAVPPTGMTLRPTLEAGVDGGRKGRIEAELSYLTGGLTWSAEHTVVRTGEGSASWSASVTVENTSGRAYMAADLKLVAGEPQRVGPMPVPKMRTMAVEIGGPASAPDLGEESFAEYHLYTLGRPATLRDRESQSLSMIEPRAVKMTPRYLYRGGAPGIAAQLVLVNTAANGLGLPLPAGRVRFYEKDAAGAPQFTGETRIAHTAEGEKLTLDIGTVFDLAAERREVYNKRITDREREYQVEIKLRNRKKNDVRIVVEEPVAGDHEVLRKTHEFTRKDANTLQFEVSVPAGKEVILDYTIRVRY